ncbi:GerMN domain-containing protein [Selenomonas sp. TAMA-11512]|uniref:GerMN domain-containing protein n=1 Tax=Selenomonas sp. TAMA-11512 TaxID=3095337 RepID=UPI00308997E4|nr:GerMN domain-containing protein [Selenomonas sp. TAMA-11512]
MRETRQRKYIRALFSILMVAVFMIVTGCDRADTEEKDNTRQEQQKKDEAGKNTPAAKDTLTVTVYYPDDNGMYLIGETRTVEVKNDKYKAVLDSLLQGTKKKGVVNIIPKEAKLRSVKVAGDTATVDFSGEFTKKFTGGSTGEELMVGSIVNTLTEFSEIQNVIFKVNGKSIETIAGHMDMSVPQKRMTDLIK